MRILHVSDVYLPRLGGLEVQVHDLARAQRAAGHEVSVVTATRASGTPALDGAAPGDVTAQRVALTPSWGPLLAAHRPDVVHCHTSIVSPLAWTAARAATRRGRPVVVTMHSLVPPRGPQAVGWRQVARLLGPDVAWTAVSRVAADALAPLVDAPVAVLPNGVDPGRWTPAAPGTAEVPTVVAVMRLTHRKRAVELVDVLRRVHRATGGAPLRAVVAGDGPARPAVERAVRQAGLSGVVELPGRLTRPEVATLLAGADVFVAPAHLESFGIAALEARCAGLPVVAMRRGGVGDFVREGVEGFLVADDVQMAQRVAALLLDRDRLRAMAAHVRAAPVDLAWPAVVARSLEAYAGARPCERRGQRAVLTR